MKYVFCLLFALLASITQVTAATDPVPNPFASLEATEQLFMGTVAVISDGALTVENETGDRFTAPFADIFKYRDGASVAAENEFALKDHVRFIGTTDGVLTAVQNYDLLICDQNFYGWVREVHADSFHLETVQHETFTVSVNNATQFRDENRELLFGYHPRVSDILRVHGVFNQNTKEVFTSTLGSYITLLTDESLAPVLAETAAVEAAAVSEAADAFTDLALETDYRAAIGFVKQAGIVGGYDDGSYRPAAGINRAEFAKILMEARFHDELTLTGDLAETCFPDVPQDAWFARYVCLAKEKGVIGGYPDGTFQPANPVNLAEATKIIVASYGFAVDPAADGEAWYAPFIARAEKLQILPAGFAAASDGLTRGQMAELVMRAVKYRRGDLVDYLDSLQAVESTAATATAE